MNLSSNKLFERLLDQNHKSEIEKDKELRLKLQNNLEALEKAEYTKVELEKYITHLETSIQVKNAMIKAAEMSEYKPPEIEEKHEEEQPEKPDDGKLR